MCAKSTKTFEGTAATTPQQEPHTDNNSTDGKYRCGSRTSCSYSWLVVCASFVVRILVGGFWPALGLFFIEWREYFVSSSSSDISQVGSVSVTILWTSGLIASALSQRLSFRCITIAGGIIATCPMVAASTLVETLPHLVITFALSSFGMGLALISVQSVLVFTFEDNIGIAVSLANTGAAVGLFVMPPLFQYLNETYGWRGCLMIASGIYANICVCAAILRPTTLERQMRERVKERRNTQRPSTNSNGEHTFSSKISRLFSETKRSFGLTLFYTNIRFIAFCVCGLITGLSYTPVLIYLVPKAVDGGVSKRNTSYLISIIGLSSLFARLAAGRVVNHRGIPASRLCGASYAISGLITMFFPIPTSFPLLATLAAAFGLSTGVFNCIHLLVAKEYVGVDNTSVTFAWFMTMSAIGGFAGMYVSGYLYDITGNYWATFSLAGSLSLLCGIMLLCEPCLQSLQHLLDNRLNRGNYKRKVHDDVKTVTLNPAEDRRGTTKGVYRQITSSV